MLFRSIWISEIIDTGKKNPLFKVYMEDNPKFTFQAESPSAPWSNVLKAIAKAKKEPGRSIAISGPEAFLLASPIVTYLIQKLPNVELCKNYIFKDFKNSNNIKSTKTQIQQQNKPIIKDRPIRERKKIVFTDTDSDNEISSTSNSIETEYSN